MSEQKIEDPDQILARLRAALDEVDASTAAAAATANGDSNDDEIAALSDMRWKAKHLAATMRHMDIWLASGGALPTIWSAARPKADGVRYRVIEVAGDEHRHRFQGQTLTHSHPHAEAHGYYGHEQDPLPHEPSDETGTYEPAPARGCPNCGSTRFKSWEDAEIGYPIRVTDGFSWEYTGDSYDVADEGTEFKDDIRCLDCDWDGTLEHLVTPSDDEAEGGTPR